MRTGPAAGLLPLVLAACVPPADPPDGPPAIAPAAPAPLPADAAARDSARAELRLLSREPLRGRSPATLGLTGANKPNGTEYRLRVSVPRETPRWIPRELDGLGLTIADPVRDGWVAFYRGALEGGPGSTNARFVAALFGPGGTRAWDVELNRHLSRPEHLEIQDLRYADGAVYFNEACQSYSREADGRCSSLVRLDPRAGRVEWRTRPLTSSGIFLLHGPFVVSGYGFTAEPDSLFLVERRTGEIAARAPLDSAATYLEVSGGRLVVLTHRSVYTFALPAPAVAGR